MKKFLAASLAVLCVLACPVMGNAQGLTYDVTAAVDLPMGDFGDAVGTGFGVGADVFFWSPASMPELQVGGRAAFNLFTANETDFGFAGKVKTSANTIEIMPSVKYTLPSSGDMTFFGQAGFGIFIVNAKTETTSTFFGSAEDSNSDTKVGLTIAGGAEMPFSGRTLVIMPLFSLVEDTNYLGLNVGLKLK
jgi:opacity protein-like surface antigen